MLYEKLLHIFCNGAEKSTASCTQTSLNKTGHVRVTWHWGAFA